MPRNPNDASTGGQSSSGDQQQQVTQPSDITVAAAADSTVKSDQVSASSMGQLKLKLDEFHLTDEHKKAIVDNCLQNE